MRAGVYKFRARNQHGDFQDEGLLAVVVASESGVLWNLQVFIPFFIPRSGFWLPLELPRDFFEANAVLDGAIPSVDLGCADGRKCDAFMWFVWIDPENPTTEAARNHVIF